MNTDKLKSTAFLSPKAASAHKGVKTLYDKEKEALKKEFESMGGHIDWSDPVLVKKLNSFARLVIETVTDNIDQNDLVSLCLPTQVIEPGDTAVLHEIHGPAIYQASYGAAVRMSRPQFTKFTAVTNLKEVGLKLDLAQLQRGKYSASELADYIVKLVTAWRNRLLFVTTLAGATEYQTSGAQHVDGSTWTSGKYTSMLTAITDEAETKLLVGRRQAIHVLSTTEPFSIAGASDSARVEFENTGMVGSYAGVPIVKPNSFVDLDYGVVYPMPVDDLWLWSEMPAGRYVQAGALRTSNETILRSEQLHLYFRWDDGITIWYTDRIVRAQSVGL